MIEVSMCQILRVVRLRVLVRCRYVCLVFFFKQKTAYEMRISDWSSDVCSSDLFSTPNRVGTQQYTDEFQISGNILNDKLTFITGAFYLKDKPWGDNYLVVDLYRPPVVPDSTLNAAETYYSASSFALFGQIGYDLGSLIDGLTLDRKTVGEGRSV